LWYFNFLTQKDSNMELNMRKIRTFAVLIFALVFLNAPLQMNRVTAASTNTNKSFQSKTSHRYIRPSASINSILNDVTRQMEPALTDFMTTFSFNRVSKTESNLEAKYRSKKLSINWDVSSDSKLFVVIKVSGKQYCYTNTGKYSIKLRKSTRCR
jgi:hypothetical protein